MAAGEETTDSRPPARLTDREAAEAWRFSCFIEMGFPYNDAITLAKAKADHWEVQRVIDKGCPHAQAVAIFA